jgi:hypothetical protein
MRDELSESGVRAVPPKSERPGVAHLLEGAVAAFRCRHFLAMGHLDAARRECGLLEQAILALGRIGLEPVSDVRVRALVLQAERLYVMLAQRTAQGA